MNGDTAAAIRSLADQVGRIATVAEQWLASKPAARIWPAADIVHTNTGTRYPGWPGAPTDPAESRENRFSRPNSPDPAPAPARTPVSAVADILYGHLLDEESYRRTGCSCSWTAPAESDPDGEFIQWTEHVAGLIIDALAGGDRNGAQA